MVEQTEGWATGLRLAAMFATRTGRAERLAGFTGDDRTVTAHLAGEVLATLPAERRRFLLRTSIVDRLCADLADNLSGGAAGSASWRRSSRPTRSSSHSDPDTSGSATTRCWRTCSATSCCSTSRS